MLLFFFFLEDALSTKDKDMYAINHKKLRLILHAPNLEGF